MGHRILRRTPIEPSLLTEREVMGDDWMQMKQAVMNGDFAAMEAITEAYEADNAAACEASLAEIAMERERARRRRLAVGWIAQGRGLR
jgi:hypothetical protein